MNDIDYRTGGGGSTLTTRSPGVPATAASGVPVPPIGDLSRLAAALIAKRDEEEAAARAAAGRGPAQIVQPSGGEDDTDVDRERNAKAMRDLALRDAMLTQAHREAGPKIKYIGGPGIITGPTMDTMGMNAIQRDLYLPKGSGMTAPQEMPDAFPDEPLMRQQQTAQGQEQREKEDPTGLGGQYASGPGVLSGNRYASGPGVVRGRFVRR